MRFKDFLSENLDRRRGFQTQLADHLEVAKSTITAWRQGATPDFASCLKLAEYFGLDPLDIFEMLEDSNYISVYTRFFQSSQKSQAGAAPADSKAEEASVSEEDLYADAAHAQLHRDLELVLSSGAPESAAVATVVRMAARQVRRQKPRKETLTSRVASVYDTLRSDRRAASRDLPQDQSGDVAGDLRPQES